MESNLGASTNVDNFIYFRILSELALEIPVHYVAHRTDTRM
jgi:hypothetical protein